MRAAGGHEREGEQRGGFHATASLTVRCGRLEQAAAFHVRRRLDAEQVERRGGHVLDARVVGEDRAIAEEDAGNEARVDAVVAAPGLGVVLENLGGLLCRQRQSQDGR